MAARSQRRSSNRSICATLQAFIGACEDDDDEMKDDLELVSAIPNEDAALAVVLLSDVDSFLIYDVVVG